MSPRSILLVEDDRDIRDSLVDALTDAGFEVQHAVDGLDALEKLRDTATLPDLILLDLMMPRMNGAEFREAVLQVDRWKDIPVLLLTADARARDKAKELAVSGYLRKPVKLADLFRAVATHMAGQAR